MIANGPNGLIPRWTIGAVRPHWGAQAPLGTLLWNLGFDGANFSQLPEHKLGVSANQGPNPDPKTKKKGPQFVGNINPGTPKPRHVPGLLQVEEGAGLGALQRCHPGMEGVSYIARRSYRHHLEVYGSFQHQNP